MLLKVERNEDEREEMGTFRGSRYERAEDVQFEEVFVGSEEGGFRLDSVDSPFLIEGVREDASEMR